jgi:DNA (cytosine-5)-methyltransferase 1
MTPSGSPPTAAGLFAGIGGFELGFSRAGFETTLVVDNAPAAQAVLEARFPNASLVDDVRSLDRLPSTVDVVCAGFPCQDLSSVGAKQGIGGARSSLVGEVFRLLEKNPVPWVVLENVPFILQLCRGAAIDTITNSLHELGYSWAYRVLDTQGFGLPQRRRRWYLVASNTHDPRGVLLSDDTDESPSVADEPAFGFYWTEGKRSLGWAVDAVPPIKGGSSVGVPSPPAILMPDGEVVTPDIRDAERMQGFAADWTRPAEAVVKPGFRWQAVGNAVSVNVVEWIAERLSAAPEFDEHRDQALKSDRWPNAAWADERGVVHVSEVGAFPIFRARASLTDFLHYPPKPLSARAAAGFLKRTKTGTLRFQDGFLDAVRAHLYNSQSRPDGVAA